MNCPTCKNAMITLELAEIEIDHCTNCGGIWLDAGELEILLAEAEDTHQLLNSFKEDKSLREKLRRCPICDKKMQKILVGTSKFSVLIDKCRRGHGLWFDKGELNDILGKARLDKNNRIQKLLADMFGHEQI